VFGDEPDIVDEIGEEGRDDPPVTGLSGRHGLSIAAASGPRRRRSRARAVFGGGVGGRAGGARRREPRSALVAEPGS
jgi:hypothetical protein